MKGESRRAVSWSRSRLPESLLLQVSIRTISRALFIQHTVESFPKYHRRGWKLLMRDLSRDALSF